MSRARRGDNPELGTKVAMAKLRYTRVGPRKIRAVADLLRGLDVTRAMAQLSILHRPSAVPLLQRLIKSAVSNANTEGERYNEDDLIIGSITVDGGPVTARFRPRAMGRSARIRKLTSHVTVELYTSPAAAVTE